MNLWNLSQYPSQKGKVFIINGLNSGIGLKEVRTFAESFQNQFERSDLLINNAGIMMSPYKETEDKFENQLADSDQATKDIEIANKMWSLAEEMTGVRF